MPLDQNVKDLLNRAAHELEALKRDNAHMRARLIMFDDVMMLVKADTQRNHGGTVSAPMDPSYEIRRMLDRDEEKGEAIADIPRPKSIH